MPKDLMLKNIKKEMLSLSKNGNTEVCESIARNRAPIEVLDILVKDESEFVRERVVENLELRSS